ncbi:TetR/AcrR family transcriptional regulator [Clostridium hydrogenum]|uniref:TetR/AcrR family transcriptional regulator n=1 Tax=Clostridium hydrogenum TaxID=2855764 RepID=UPI001F3BD6A0|nr:TetR/AcrR family transcriptional regulator [Clostridium hydrogenum]
MHSSEIKKSTKQKIFETSVKLFSKEGYNGVSMRQIAKEVGIKESSIYNHYKNKEEILISLFDYFAENLTAHRPSEEEIEKMLSYMSVEDVFKQLIISFGRSLNGTLDDIARIIYTEQFRNEKAKKLMLENMISEPSRFIIKVLKIMYSKKMIKKIDMELIADEYNYGLLALTFEYAHAVNNGEDTALVIKKMFKHVSFICEYIKLD